MAEEKKENVKVKRPTALKRDIQNEKRRLENRSFKARVTTAIRSLEKEIAVKAPTAKEKLQELQALIDKGAKKGIFKMNKASRLKSRFTSKV